jgi:hypothetical protein
MSEQAYPLSWPHGWPRHKGSQDSDTRFRGPTYHWDRVYRGLIEEVRRIGGKHVVVSTNQPLRQDGAPYAQQRNIQDVGVAVYFVRNGKPMVMAQDRFWTIMGNMRSLTMAIEGLRQMERHGGAAMMERAFDGFTALPKPSGADWWEVLQVDRKATRSIIEAKFRELARSRHPDRGGSDHAMAELNRARDQALQEVA